MGAYKIIFFRIAATVSIFPLRPAISSQTPVPDIGDVVEIAPDYVIWRDMNITVRQDANDETRRFAAWLQTDEATPAFKKYGWTRKGV